MIAEDQLSNLVRMRGAARFDDSPKTSNQKTAPTNLNRAIGDLNLEQEEAEKNSNCWGQLQILILFNFWNVQVSMLMFLTKSLCM